MRSFQPGVAANDLDGLTERRSSWYDEVWLVFFEAKDVKAGGILQPRLARQRGACVAHTVFARQLAGARAASAGMEAIFAASRCSHTSPVGRCGDRHEMTSWGVMIKSTPKS